MYYVISQYVILYHDRYSASFLHVCCIAFDTVYPYDIHIVRYGFVSVLKMIRARVKLENIASMSTSTSEREDNGLVMLFFPQAHNPLWAGSRGVVGLLPRGCEQAHLGCWAYSFGVLGRAVWDVELRSSLQPQDGMDIHSVDAPFVFLFSVWIPAQRISLVIQSTPTRNIRWP